eukprot:scaffold8119_cov444-Prasinococcus_capsulatus_cf.AAC.9
MWIRSDPAVLGCLLSSVGLIGSSCSPTMLEDGYLQLFYYANYLLKYYEFVDTIVMALRGKRAVRPST